MISHSNSATPTGGFMDFPAAQAALGPQHTEIINEGSGVASLIETMSASVVSTKILQVVNRDGPRIRGLDFFISLLDSVLLPDPETLCNAILLITMAIAGRPGETLISLCQLWAGRTGSHDGSSHLYLATIFLLLNLPAD
ncbi:hypothetical protein CY34DRAFT_802789 [Suillus luteus UH-Slu-Lm8-n1]|uniref:Unplaced genomic scaffold CY34scaffold_62, whole genome shotgun sequence n=1 Tax=Suillus luteus UH-Slu-Lm8-n1 TaxID=930992 RepID=A0A0D0BLW3_9AGAM|nr:hypothetical protein CY34DRAFT_802789 [Suillus luteus UH-Slu-Lm8-n1]